MFRLNATVTPPWWRLVAVLAVCVGCGSSGSTASVCGDGVVDDDELCDDAVNDDLGGGCLPGCQQQDLTDELFARDLLDVSIDMDPADWEGLRQQYKTPHVMFAGTDCRMRQIENPYTWFPATVTIDGEIVGNTGLRKKGHIGSQSTVKPSLKLDFGRFLSSQRFNTVKRLALNNSKNDAAYLRSCMAYSVFTAAGLPAPKCTYARVTVNGTYLGVYFAIEEIKSRFLKRYFTNAEGNLYEGTACDFRPEFFGGFEQETNELIDTSRRDLQTVYDAAQNSADANFERDLDETVNLDAFFKFWAAEILVWHRDGYGGNANNYNLYADPNDGGRFHFIPWGPDSAFKSGGPSPRSVLASGVLTHRLYGYAATRVRYSDELNFLLDNVWDETALLGEVDRVSALLTPHLLSGELAGFTAAIDEVKTFISGRRSEIELIVAGGLPDWTRGMRSLPCRVPVGTVSASFSTTWDSMSQGRTTTGIGTMSMTLDAAAVTMTQVNARGGPFNNSLRMEVYGTTTDSYLYQFLVPYPSPAFFDPFMVLGSQGFTRPPISATARRVDANAAGTPTLEIGQGTWTFTQIGSNTGDPIAATFDAELFQRYAGLGL